MTLRAGWIGAFLVAFVLSGVPAGAASGGDVPAADARAIRSVIEAQLKALSAGDAALAFSYASPSIRMQFPDASGFLSMVRQGYPMLIRPAETLFLQPRAVDTGVMQRLHLRDREGESWLATYHMLQQDDGTWRINGCTVRAEDGGGVI